MDCTITGLETSDVIGLILVEKRDVTRIANITKVLGIFAVLIYFPL
jgi:hypothetical protein